MKTPDQGVYKIGDPYQIDGIWYYPSVDYRYMETGIASWYGSKFHKKKTANGGIYDMNKLTAAHRTLPMPSFVRVTNLENGRSLVLKVNDRGPYANNRIIDVSRRGAQLLGFEKKGTARARVEILPNESRAIAARMMGRSNLAAAETPITVGRLPKPTVNTQPLAAPRGMAPRGMAPMAASYSAPQSLPDPTLEKVSMRPVSPTRLFIQAGAFSRYGNATRSRAVLSKLGNASISQVLINGRDMFRVRIGPLRNVAKADQLLVSVVKSGYYDARIIVD